MIQNILANYSLSDDPVRFYKVKWPLAYKKKLNPLQFILHPNNHHQEKNHSDYHEYA